MKKSQRQLLQVIAGFVISLIAFVLASEYRDSLEPHTFMERVAADVVVLAGIGSGLVAAAFGAAIIAFVLSMIDNN